MAIFCISLIPNLAASEDLNTLIQQVKVISEQRESIEGEISAIDGQLKTLEEYLTKTEAEISATEEDIKKIEEDLGKERSFLAESTRTLYEEGQTSLFELIIGSNTFSDFVDKREYRTTVQGKLQDTVNIIEKLEKDQKRKRESLVRLRAIQTIVKKGLEKQKSDKETNLTQLKEEEIRIRDKFAERISRGARGKFCADKGQVIKAKNSIFKFPINCGYISQGYGMTEFASIDKAYNGAIHNGIDVGIDTGAEIYSVGKGEVYAKGAEPSGGWGNWVMIKHNKVTVNGVDIEFYSLYAHMVTETHLKVGEKVEPGTLVGLVGGTPYWAPHLHFSLFLSSSGWSDTKPGSYPGNTVDPLDYMDIPISTDGTDWDPLYYHK